MTKPEDIRVPAGTMVTLRIERPDGSVVTAVEAPTWGDAYVRPDGGVYVPEPAGGVPTLAAQKHDCLSVEVRGPKSRCAAPEQEIITIGVDPARDDTDQL